MTAPALRRWRGRWRVLHRWLGLTLGLLLLSSGLSGAAMVFGRDLDQRAHPHLFEARQPDAAPRPDLYAQALALLRQRHGAEAALTLRPPRTPHETLQVFVDAPAWHGVAYLDPRSAALLGERADTEGVFGWLFEWHSALLGATGGPPLLALAAGAYLALLATGVWLWWPRHLRGAFTLRRGAGARPLLFDLHRSAGVLLSLPIAVSVASGAWMAWRPLSQAVTALAGTAATVPPRLAPGHAPPQDLHDADAVIARAQAALPDAMLSYVGWPPAAAARPVRVRLKLPDDPHPNGLSSVWLDPASGQVLRVDRWNRLDPGNRAYAWIYPLHTGALGGPWHRLLNLLLGLALAAIGAAGIAMWGLRRRVRGS